MLGLIKVIAGDDTPTKEYVLRVAESQDEKDFLETCKPELDTIEEFRLVKLRNYKLRKSIAIPVATLLTPILAYLDYWLIMLQRSSDDGFAGVTFFVIGAIYWWATQPRRQYAKEYKQKIMPRIIKLFGNFNYQIDGCLDLEALKPSGIFPSFTSKKSEDCFTGEYMGVGMEFSELELTSGSGKNRRTVFKGMVILLDLRHKKFLGKTILRRNAGNIQKWFQGMVSDLEHARMADPEFEKIFDVHTNDQVESRWLVDPAMIEKLKALYTEYEGKGMLASWYDNKMLILINSQHNHFEPAHLETPATHPGSILSMKREIAQVLSIIDRLSLYDAKKIHA